MEYIGFGWKIIEAGYTYLVQIRYNKRQRLAASAFKREAENAFERAVSFLQERGVKKKSFLIGNKDTLADTIVEQTIQKDGFFYFYPGELEINYLDLFNLPKDNRIDVFLKFMCLAIMGGERLLIARILFEHTLAFLGKKHTVLHYTTIPGWSTQPIKVLVKQVELVKRPLPIKNEKFSGQSPKQDHKPKIYKTIEVALKQGKISQLTVLNLASSQKLLLVLKYSEGVGNVFNYQKEEQTTLENKIKELEKSNNKSSVDKLTDAKKELKQLRKNFDRAPLNTTLERHGFQKIFRNMDGVYVIPIYLLPSKYQNAPEVYLDEVILKEATRERRRIAEKFAGKAEIDPNLQFIMLAHVLRFNELFILAQDRELAISSPELYKTLFANYLLQADTEVSQLYLNDVVRNVDFASLLSDTQTGNFIRGKLDQLKELLWKKYSINLLTPMTLATLSSSAIDDISTELVKGKRKPGKLRSQIKKMLSEKVEFYRSLSQELDALKGL